MSEKALTMTTVITQRASGGQVWEFPAPDSITSKKAKRRNALGTLALVIAVVSGVASAVFLHQSMLGNYSLDESRSAPGAMPVFISNGNQLQYAIILVVSLSLIVAGFIVAKKMGTLNAMPTLMLVLTILGLTMSSIAQLFASMMLLSGADVGGYHRTSAWVQETYNLTLLEPLTEKSGQVKAKDVAGQEVVLKILHFNNASYLYQTDAELLELMEKIKKP